MNIERKIYKAALLLDLKGDIEQAEKLLREAVSQAQEDKDLIGQVRAGTFLGQLLVDLGRGDEAFQLLRSIIDLSPAIETGIVEVEINRARALLELMQSPALE